MRQRPLLWRVSGSQASYCVARLATAAARRARGVVLAPDYSSPRRLSAACPPTGRGSGPAQGTSSRGEGSHPTWATSGGPGYAAPRDYSGTSRRRHRAHLQAWIHIQHPHKPPAFFRPDGRYTATRTLLRVARGNIASPPNYQLLCGVYYQGSAHTIMPAPWTGCAPR